MRNCALKIASSVDGRKTDFYADGKIEFSENGLKILYREEGAIIRLVLQENIATVEREGDYSLRLVLKIGELCNGTLGIGGNNGEIQAMAHRADFTIKDDSVLLFLHYDLVLGTEKQKMELRILAKIKE